ncbi:IucA/IucC family protein [Litchfieldia salsa]|uniref:Siderophore synthetase component n=1 Tax=Litchfieldia salsa TaxID=930152 RepID=A0A1H0S171_9BACI|nr:IucA/IucC family protein [Litchfieldia salsa]SDP35444.1 Siderophore synthetase component [Litchfieldia salsa]
MKTPYLIPSKKINNRVKRQLVEAMIYEGLIEFEEVNEGLFHLFGQERTYWFKGRRSVFDRIRINDEGIFQVLTNHQHITQVTINELLEECVSDEMIKNRVLYELVQTINLCDWNEKHLPIPLARMSSSYEELESEIMEGHLYHPCFKSRTGFTLEDHEQYGPEGKQSFPLLWTAIRRNNVKVSLLEDESDFWKRELGDGMWDEITMELAEAGVTFEDYTLLPIHPWQWKSIHHHLLKLIETGELIILQSKGDWYRATQSVRTLWNEIAPKKANIKLSMNMINTSSLRTLSTPSVCAAPYISAWLQKVIQSDSYLADEASIVILKEYAGICFDSESKSELTGQLGAIWRESIRTYMKEGEEAVPFTALMTVEKTGQLFIEAWLSHYGLEKWVTRLIEVSVIPVWHLLVAHGIAVEAHAQNMILLHKNGWPTRIVLRDFHESIEYTSEFITDPYLVPNFQTIHYQYRNAPLDKYYRMSSVEALRELVMDTLFVYHFSELSYLLEEKSGFKEEQFWKLVKLMISNHIDKHQNLQERHDQIQYSNSEIYVESLLTKKIKKKQKEYRHLVGNIFS